jgi:hypothetical protein
MISDCGETQKVKVKVNFSLERAMKTQRGSRDIAFFNPGTR